MKTNCKETFYLSLGTVGAIIAIYGIIYPAGNLTSTIGSIFLLLTAIFYRLPYFVALEVIVMDGHGAIFFGMGPVITLILPILLCLQLLVYYILSGQLQSVFHLIGIIGIAVLSLGLSYTNQWAVLLGCASIAAFSFHETYTGCRIALIWAVLNTFFALGTVYLFIMV